MIGGSIYQLGHGSARPMLWTERQRFMLLALELAPTRYCRGIRLARDEAEPGDVLRLIEDSKRIWIRACVGLSIQTFETRIDQSRRTPEKTQIEVQSHDLLPRHSRRRLTLEFSGAEGVRWNE